MNVIALALRNLGRNRRRTALAATSVGISIMMVVVMNGMVGGFLGSIVKNYTKNDAGHVNVVTEGYREQERFSPVDKAIPDSAAVISALRSIPALKGATFAERIRFGVLLSSGNASKAALGIAGEPEAERRLLMLDRSILPGGRYLAGPGEVIVGEGLARDLGLSVDDELKVLTQRADYGLGFKKFKIVGIIRTHVNSIDNAVFQIGLADARSLLALEGGAQQILIMLDDYRKSEAAAQAIREAIPGSSAMSGLSAKSWTEMGDFPRFVQMAASIYMWAYVFVAFLGAFIITNIMMMIVLERKKEIGILKSMGMSPLDILALFLTEGTMMGTLGAAIGAALGFALNLVMSKVGFDMSAAMAGFDWPMDNIIYFTVSVSGAVALFGLGAIVSSIVSLLPSRNAAIMNPIDAIRSV